MGAYEVMAGFDILVSGVKSPEDIKQKLLCVFKKKQEEAYFYEKSSELIFSSLQPTLLVGFYRKFGAVDWLLSIEHDLSKDEKTLAAEISKSINKNCYLPDSSSSSDEDYIELGPTYEKGRQVKLVEDDEGNRFDLSPSQRGASLLDFVFAIGFMSLLTWINTSIYFSLEKAHRIKNYQISLVKMISQIENYTDCESTLEVIANSCSPGDILEIQSQNGGTLIASADSFSDYEKIEDFRVRALCINCSSTFGCEQGVRIQIEAIFVDNNGNKKPHPLYETEEWFTLYDTTRFKCIL